MTKYCSQCGAEIPEDNKFCGECGFELNSTDKSTIKTVEVTGNTGDFFTYSGGDIDRTPEMVLSIIGAIVGICLAAWIFYGAYVLGAVGSAFGAGLGAIISSTYVSFLLFDGIVCIIGAIISLIAGINVRKNPKFYGIILLIGSVCFILTFSLYGILPLVIVAVAGILAIVRK